MRSRKSSKYNQNEYKSSLGGIRQNPIGALNSARIGEGAKSKQLKNISSKIVEVWIELKK
jgi:hypothetical protein